jgi:hypothetical protein
MAQQEGDETGKSNFGNCSKLVVALSLAFAWRASKSSAAGHETRADKTRREQQQHTLSTP